MENSGDTATPINEDLRETITRLAIDVVNGMVTWDWDRSNAAMDRLVNEFGCYLATAIMAWCDYAAVAAKRSFDDIGDADKMIREACDSPGDTQWAARVFKARVDLDRDRFMTIVDEINLMDGRTGFREIHRLASLSAAVVAASVLFGDHYVPDDHA